MGCLGLNLVRLRLRGARKLMRSSGLEARQVQLPNGSSMDCWLPSKKKLDRDALLLVHGFGLNALLEWENQIQAFAKEFDVYAPSILFCGSSTTECEQRSEVFQAECMKQMLDELGVSKVHVLGSSYGGMVAFWMAHLYPEAVAKVVLASSGVTMHSDDLTDLLERFGGVTHVSDILMPTTVAGAKKSIEFVVQKKLVCVPNCLLEDMIEEVLAHNRDRRIELLDGMVIGSKNAPELPTLSQDVLVVWGDNDQIFRLDMAHQLKKHLGNVATLVIIPKAAHTPHAENPKAFNAPVLEFLLKEKHKVKSSQVMSSSCHSSSKENET